MAQLTIHLSGKLSLVETLSLSLLWCIVFGPNSDAAQHFRNLGDRLWYRIDRPSAEQMKSVLNSRDWQADAYANNRETEKVREAMAMMEENDWGMFETVITSVFDKITRVDVT